MASVDEILEHLDPIDIMEPYVDLARVNDTTYKGLCPFHEDKNPSFFVNPEKNGIYHCFGCGVSGNLITFLEQLQNKDFMQVMQDLASDVGMEFSTTQISEERKYQNYLNDLFDKMQTKFDFDLTHKTQIRQVYESILSKRKLTIDDVRAFNLGYIDTGSLNGFMDSHDIPMKDKINTGTYRVNEQGELYPSLNKRITFKLRRLNGDIVGFTGEKTYEQQQPKYKIAVKKGVIQDYFYYIGDKLPKHEPIYMCEGLYDVISLKLAGIKSPISTLGTQTTDEQIKKLLDYNNNFVLCYDGDEPGLNAAVNIYHQIKELDNFNDVKIKFIQIPNNLDPDDYRKQFGLDQFKKLINKPITPVDFVLQLYYKQIAKNKPDKVSTIKSLLSIIMEYTQDNIEQDVYLNWLVKKSGINKEELLKYYDDKTTKELENQAKKHVKQNQVKPKEFQERDIQDNNDNDEINISNIIGSTSTESPKVTYSFDSILFVREKSVLNYLIHNPNQIKYLKSEQYRIFYHELSIKLFKEMCEINSDNFENSLINKIKGENNLIELLLEDILKLDTNKKEFLINLKLLDSYGKQDYNKELELQKLEDIGNINDIINIYKKLKGGN